MKYALDRRGIGRGAARISYGFPRIVGIKQDTYFFRSVFFCADPWVFFVLMLCAARRKTAEAVSMLLISAKPFSSSAHFLWIVHPQ
ncbi:hypothetical protein D4R75_06765 [bacterium]|nr:MAG: hypothetical protein D4R75_06765 [bacterium]